MSELIKIGLTTVRVRDKDGNQKKVLSHITYYDSNKDVVFIKLDLSSHNIEAGDMVEIIPQLQGNWTKAMLSGTKMVFRGGADV